MYIILYIISLTYNTLVKWHVLSFIIQRPFQVFGFLNFTYSRALGIFRIAALKLCCVVLLCIPHIMRQFLCTSGKRGHRFGCPNRNCQIKLKALK